MLERKQHTVPCMFGVERIAPWALVKGSRGLGRGGRWGCGAAGPGSLGLGLQAMPWTTPAYAPRLAATGSKPRTPMIFDPVGDYHHAQ